MTLTGRAALAALTGALVILAFRDVAALVTVAAALSPRRLGVRVVVTMTWPPAGTRTRT